MKAIIRIHLKQFFTKRLLFLIIGCLLFSIGERQTTSGSYELYVLNMLTEHYYLTYMMIPTYLLLFYQSLEHLPEFVLIRTEYFWKSFLARVVTIFINAFSFVGIQIIIFLIVGIGLKARINFQLPFQLKTKWLISLVSIFKHP